MSPLTILYGLEAKKLSVKGSLRSTLSSGGCALSSKPRIEELALSIVERVYNSKLSDEAKKRFKTRARSMVSDLYSSGVAYVVSICAARSSAIAVELGLSASNPEGFIKVIENKNVAKNYGVSGDEECGYAIYGASILYALKVFGLLNTNKLGDAIRELLGNTLADRKAFQFAIWLKRFAEAYIYEL